MPFEAITHIKVSKYGESAGKPIAPSTVRLYKRALNDLADAGIDTIQKLVEEPEFVITLIDMLADDDSKGKQEKRIFYSAVFYALDPKPNEDKKPYYDAFQKLKDKKPGEYKPKEK